MSVFVVVTILDLTMECSKLNTFITSTRVGSINDGISQLDIEQVELHWIIAVNVLIREEEFLSES